MNVVARVSIAVAVVMAIAGLVVLMTMYTWVALTMCAAALLLIGWGIYDFLSLHSKD